MFKDLSATLWICFGLGILITFSLWWIFFSLIADRECKKGFLAGNLMTFFYIPALASLGIAGASFPGVMSVFSPAAAAQSHVSRVLFGASLSPLLWSITAISLFLVYPPEYRKAKRILQPLLIISGAVILLLTLFLKDLSLIAYLLAVFTILMSIIVVITTGWFRVQIRHLQEKKG